ncbi:hypothetical protein FKW77_008328 [Venturia effusa]|uniref:Nudix hydrolase domain-containing protein n=1 Tax=Venturia effusa TaxID=50376 RepID=A0A517LCP3_9PEZI|nr:hypothetical protein FKW77_008328 [Venturia effusa]
MADPKVGVGLFVFRPDGTFIVGKRKGALGSGSLGLPGGHLEPGESFATCAARELLEETGIEVKESEIHFLTAGNNVFVKEGKHYVTIAMGVMLRSARAYLEPKVLEPEKCDGWQWISWKELRTLAEGDLKSGTEGEKKLFQPMVEFVTQDGGGFDPFEVLREKMSR